MLTFGQQGEKVGQFQYPLCISIGENDFLYVSDLNNNRIQIFSPFGQFLSSLGQIDGSTLIKAPCITTVDSHGKLYIGLTFDSRVFRFSISSESLKSLADDRGQSDSKNPEWFTLQGQLAEQSEKLSIATDGYTKAVQLTQSEKNFEHSAEDFDTTPLLNISRISLKDDNPLKNETTLLNGIEIFSTLVTRSREKVLEVYEDWEKVGRELSDKEFKEQMDILEEREDPRFFNQELFDVEKQEKTLFRAMRAISYQHCQLSNQFAEYTSNLICALNSPKIIQTSCDGF